MTPGFDGTGPCGQGPMTGRASGYCMMKVDPPPGCADFDRTVRLEQLCGQLRHLEAALECLRERIDRLAGAGESV